MLAGSFNGVPSLALTLCLGDCPLPFRLPYRKVDLLMVLGSASVENLRCPLCFRYSAFPHPSGFQRMKAPNSGAKREFPKKGDPNIVP